MMHNPYFAILAAALAAWVFGAIWYGVLGRAWMAAQGWSAAEIDERRKVGQMPLKPMVLSFICELIMALVLSWLLAGLGVVEWHSALETGLVLGFGLMALPTAVNNVFPGRKPMLSVIDGAHWIIVAMIECLVLFSLS
jgi:hypothetical protein